MIVMRLGPAARVVLWAGLFLGGAAIGLWMADCPAPRVDSDEIARAQRRIAQLEAARDSIRAVADSLATVAAGGADTVRVEVDAYRAVAGRLRARLDSSRGGTPVTLDPAEAARALDRADRVAASCLWLARDCDRALAAKDAALEAADSVIAAHQLRAAQLDAYAAGLAARLQRSERSRWLWAAGGAAVSLTACRAAR